MQHFHGQVRLPGLPPLITHSRHRLDAGRFYRESPHSDPGDAPGELVLGAGIGASGLPLRLFCPPEAVLLDLLPGEPATGLPHGSAWC